MTCRRRLQETTWARSTTPWQINSTLLYIPEVNIVCIQDKCTCQTSPSDPFTPIRTKRPPLEYHIRTIVALRGSIESLFPAGFDEEHHILTSDAGRRCYRASIHDEVPLVAIDAN